MTDTPPASVSDAAAATVPRRVDDFTLEMPNGELIRVCAKADCDETFIVNPQGFGARRKFCDGHLSAGGGRRGDKRPKRDRAPTSVRVQVGAGRARARGRDPELAAVEARVAQAATMAAGLLMLAGGEHGPADAADLNAGKAALAAAVAGLAEYYPAIRKLAAGGDGSGKLTAWLQLVVAALTILAPILLRHGAVPESIARFLDLAGAVAPPPAQPAPADHAGESVAA